MTQDQTITFSAVGAHHQNGVAERNIQTIMSWALSMMSHQLLHWPDAFDEALWPFALEHAVYLWNHLPKSRSGLSPHELFTGSMSPNREDMDERLIMKPVSTSHVIVDFLDHAFPKSSHHLESWSGKRFGCVLLLSSNDQIG